jgi:hypothetical protein
MGIVEECVDKFAKMKIFQGKVLKESQKLYDMMKDLNAKVEAMSPEDHKAYIDKLHKMGLI